MMVLICVATLHNNFKSKDILGKCRSNDADEGNNNIIMAGSSHIAAHRRTTFGTDTDRSLLDLITASLAARSCIGRVLN